MDVRVYEVFIQFKRGFDHALTSLGILEKLVLESPPCIAKIRINLSEPRSYANNCFASKIAQKEQEEENNFYRIRRNREKANPSQRSTADSRSDVTLAHDGGNYR
jgi:hypothetical protein